MKKIDLIVKEAEEEMRLDVFLTDKMQDFTRSYIQTLIKSQYVKVNNNKDIKANYRVKYNDVIEVVIPSSKPEEILEEPIPLDILYEDDYIAIIDKPKGMVVHPASGNYSGTLVNALLYHFDKLSNIGGEIRPGIVHRLDKDTSGLLIVAKCNEVHKELARQLKARKITRIYWTIVEGNIKEDGGTIDTLVGRHPVNRRRMAVLGSGSGRRAVTHFKVLKRFEDYTLVEVKLETGRTHQIRVHMSHMGNPIVGDILYGPKRQRFNVEGQVLHAKELAFSHPVTGEYMNFQARLPDYFLRLLKILKNK